MRRMISVLTLLFTIYPSIVSATPFGVTSNANDDVASSVTYNYSRGEYLVTWEYSQSASNHNILVQRVAENSSLLGQYTIAGTANNESNPDVVYNSTEDEYLVVWEHENAASDNHIYAIRVAGSGNPIGSVITVTSTSYNETSPVVTYNPKVNEYLVIWEHEISASNHHIYGQRISSTGLLIGGTVVVDNSGYDEKAPAVSCNNQTGQYLIAWQDGQGTSGSFDIHAKLLESTGNVSVTTFVVATWEYDLIKPNIAYNTSASQFAVVWEDHRWAWGDARDVYGQRINGNGSKIGGNFTVTGQTGNPRYNPDIDYLITKDQYVVTFDYEETPTDIDIYYREVNSDGTLPGDDVQVTNVSSSQSNSAIVSNSADKFFIVWDDERDSGTQGVNIYGEFFQPTFPSSPVFATGDAYVASHDSAILSGHLEPNGVTTVYYFQYGTTTSYGTEIPWSTASISSPAFDFTKFIDGLQPETTYHYRMVARINNSPNYGEDRTFTTPAQVSSGSISIKEVYPSLGELNTGLPVNIKGSDFDANTRLMFGPDYGNKGKILGTWQDPTSMNVIRGTTMYRAIDAGGIEVYDISIPMIPGLKDTLNIPATSANPASPYSYFPPSIYISSNGDMLYASYNGFLTAYRLSDLVVLGSLSLPAQTDSWFFTDTRLYITDTAIGLQIADIDPSSQNFMQIIDTIPTPGTTKGGRLGVVNQKAYILLDGVGLVVIEVDPSSQQYKDVLKTISDITEPSWGHIGVMDNFVVTGFEPWDSNDLTVFHTIDADPGSPTFLDILGETRLPGTPRGITAIENTVYLAAGYDLHVVDVSNPHAPARFSSTTVDNRAYSVQVQDGIAYLHVFYYQPTTYYYKIIPIDVSIPVKATEIGWVGTDDRALDVKLIGNEAYVIDGDGGVKKVDVSDAANPIVVDSFTSSSRDAAVAGQKLVNVTGCSGYTFEVYDIDPGSGTYKQKHLEFAVPIQVIEGETTQFT